MKIKLLSFLLAVVTLGLAPALSQAAFVNITPYPKSMTIGSGTLTLPTDIGVKSSGLSAEMKAEIDKFMVSMAEVGIGVYDDNKEGLVNISYDATLTDEGYKLTVSATDGIDISAKTPAGLFYAFQTIKKMLPPNVMAGKADRNAESYELPEVVINDEPRYPHRGYELDCARHFFDVAQVKRMLDVMSFYKMNRFHWHLTDDQGWRIEIPKYPKLIEAAATAPNAYWWDFENGYEYYLNRPYGPLYFTVDELKEVVAYAKERHIEVIPEVDMPGHMEAAIAAYPQFSTNPSGSYSVRYWPGVSSNILDVSNPAVMQFCRDVIDQLVEIFPYEYIHIGGDECPKTAWANSSSVQELKRSLGVETDNALQSWFSKQIADYAKTKGRKLICWNEVLTAEGADRDMVKDADIMIYDWLGGTRADGPSYQAAQLGLRSVWCSTYHYYIDYSQASGAGEPKSMAGPITLETIYNVQPSTTSDPALLPYYYGVQCNLWTEYVAEPAHVEYNSLPRMIAVAETGWTPQGRKNFASFKRRFNEDAALLDMLGYTYGRHYLYDSGDPVDIVYPAQGEYYRLITCASHDANRRDRCIELVREGSPLISSNSAVVSQLWTAPQAVETDEAYDWQHWTFEADPAGSGKYAMVCRAMPAGSVSPAMVGSSVSARWNYDSNKKNYSFVLGEHFAKGGNDYTYSIRSESGNSWWLNCAQAAQNQSVNNWSDPADGNGGIWLFSLENAEEPVYPTFDPYQSWNDGDKKMMYFMSSFEHHQLIGVKWDGSDQYLYHNTSEYDSWGVQTWVLKDPVFDEEHNILRTKLQNDVTGLYISSCESEPLTSTPGTGFFNGDAGYPVKLSKTEPAEPNVKITVETPGTPPSGLCMPSTFNIEVDGKLLYPLPATSMVKPGIVTSGSTTAGNAVSQQEITILIEPAKTVTMRCIDTEGNYLDTFYYTVWANYTSNDRRPYLSNYKFIGINDDGDYVYERESWTLTYECVVAETGKPIARITEAMPVGTDVTVKAPEIPYFKFSAVDGGTTSVKADADKTIKVKYTTDAYLETVGGFEKPRYGVHVTEVDENGSTMFEMTRRVDAGSEFLFAATLRPGRAIKSVTGNEGLDCVESHKEIVVTYAAWSGLDEVEVTPSAVNHAEGIYDIQGRRLNAITRPGLYIVNGQKLLVK